MSLTNTMNDDLLDNYNPLYDVHLRQYFALPHMQRHLKHIGLLHETGQEADSSDETYKRHHMMIDKVLRNREAELQKYADLQRKLDAAEKIEICRRIRSGATSLSPWHRAKPSRSLSRGRFMKTHRRRRSSTSTDDKDLIKKIEADNEETTYENPSLVFNRLSTNILKYRYLHKLDDETLAVYMEQLRHQLSRLERFREVSFGPYSIARHQSDSHVSWFFRRRSVEYVKEHHRSRSGKSQSPRKAAFSGSHDARPQPKRRRSTNDNSRLPPITRNVKSDPSPSTNTNVTKLPPAERAASVAAKRMVQKTVTTAASREPVRVQKARPKTDGSIATVPKLAVIGVPATISQKITGRLKKGSELVPESDESSAQVNYGQVTLTQESSKTTLFENFALESGKYGSSKQAHFSREHPESPSNIEMRPESVLSGKSLEELPMESVKIDNQQHPIPIVQEEKSEKKRIKEEQKTNISEPKDVETETAGNDMKEDLQLSSSPLEESSSRHLLPEVSAYPPSEISIGEEIESNRIEKEEESALEKIPSEIQGAGKEALLTDSVEQAGVQEAEKVRTEMSTEDKEIANVHPEDEGISKTYAEKLEIIKDETSALKTEEMPPTEGSGITKTQVEDQKTLKIEEGKLEILKSREILFQSTTVASVETDELDKPESEVLVKSIADIYGPGNVPDAPMLPEESLGMVLPTEDVVKRDVAASVITNMSPVEESAANFKNPPKTVLSPQPEVQKVPVSRNASETFLEEDLRKVHLQGSTTEKEENVTVPEGELQLPQKAENNVSDIKVSERRLEAPGSRQYAEERGDGTDNKGNHEIEVATKLSVTRDDFEEQLETESSRQQFLVESATEEYSESSKLVLSSLSEICGLVDESSELMKPKVTAAFEPMPTSAENMSETLDVKHKTIILAEAEMNGLSECERNLDKLNHDTDRNPEAAFYPSIISALPPEKYLKWEEPASEAEQQGAATSFCENGKQKVASLENQQEADKPEPRRMSGELSTAAATSEQTGKEAVVEEVTNAEKSLATESNEILEHTAAPANAFQKLSAKSEKDEKNQETSLQDLNAREEEAIKETSGVFEITPVECMQQPESVMVSAKLQHGSAEEEKQTQTATSQTIKVESDSQILAAGNLTEEEKPDNQKKKSELMDEKTKKNHHATEMKGSEAVLLSESEVEPEIVSEPKSSIAVFDVASLGASSFLREPSLKTNASISDAQNLQTESDTVSAVLTSVEQISEKLTSTDILRFEVSDTETLSGENNVNETVDVLQKERATKKEKGNGDGHFQGLIKETTHALQSSKRPDEISEVELELPRPEIHSNVVETALEGGIYGLESKMVIEGLSGNLVPVVSDIKHSEAVTPLKDHRQQVHGGTDAETISTNAATMVTETEKMFGKGIKPKVAKNFETLPKSPENLFTGSLAGNFGSIIAGVESLKKTELDSENLHAEQVLSDPIFIRGAESLHAASTLSSKIEKPVIKEISERNDEEKQNISQHHDNEKGAVKISQMKAESVPPEVVVGTESAEGIIPETDTSESENRTLFSEERSFENQKLNAAADSKDQWKVRQDEEEPSSKSESIAEEEPSSNPEYLPVRTRDTSEETVISGVSEYGEVIQQIVIYGDGRTAFGEIDTETKSRADELQEQALTSESTRDSFRKYHQAGMSIKEMEAAQSSEIRDNEESKKEVTSRVTEKEGTQQLSEKLSEFLEQYMREIIQNVVQQSDAALKPFKHPEEKITESSENLKLEKQGESDFLKSFQAPDENFQSQSIVTSSEIGHEAEQFDSDAKTYQAHSETMFTNLHDVQQLASLSPSDSAQEGDSVFLKSTNRAEDVQKQREELNKSESDGEDTCRMISSVAPEVVKSVNEELDEGLELDLSIIYGLTADGLPILGSIGNSKGAGHKLVTYTAIRDASILDNKISLTSDTNGNPELESLEGIQSRACETEAAGPDENANVSASHDLDSAKSMKLEHVAVDESSNMDEYLPTEQINSVTRCEAANVNERQTTN